MSGRRSTLSAGREHQLEAGRQHTDDFRPRPVREALADDVGSSTIAALPVFMAEDREHRQRRLLRVWRRLRLRLGQTVRLLKIASVRNPRAHDLEEVGRDESERDLLWRAVGGGDHQPRGPHGRHVLDRPARPIADIGEVLVREAHREVVSRPQIHVHDDETVRVLVGKRPQEDGVGDAEECGAGTDPERDRDRDDRREQRAAAQGAHGIQDVTCQHCRVPFRSMMGIA